MKSGASTDSSVVVCPMDRLEFGSMSETRTCERCGSEYPKRRYPSRFCSKRCANQKAPKQKVCPGCGKHFQHKWARRKYCSTECMYEDKRKPWTPEMDAIATEMRSAGATFKDIADKFGVSVYYISQRVRIPRTLACRVCGTEFFTLAKGAGATTCPDCKHRVQWSGRLSKHGMTPEDYFALSRSQGDVCAICGGVPDGRGRGRALLCVDHDHDTGEVRGLLCPSCNTGIGLLGDSASNLQSAADYIDQHRRAAGGQIRLNVLPAKQG